MKNLIRKLTPEFLIGWYHLFLAGLGMIIYGNSSRKLKVIGVTGTKGKSTTIYMAGRILEQAGYKVGWISSLSIKIGQKEQINPFHITMPGRMFIQKILRQMVRAGCQYVLIEVTSEGIKQFRHRFIHFDTAVFTNLTAEHIEAHHGFENYKKAKAKLFKALKGQGKIIVNLDDDNAKYYFDFAAQEKYGYSLEKSNFKILENGIKFSVENTNFNLKLLGQFNLYNALAAIAIAKSQGIELDIAKKALEKIDKIEGRMEEIKQGQNFRIFVDLAHTPDSFEQVFKLVKNLPHQKIIAVFGAAGGGRDKWKRPKLGQLASKYCDYLILTNEDPYDENPQQIANDIVRGLGDFKKYEIILDRRQAIEKALSIVQAQDIVLFLGKGTEATLVIGSQKNPWDDREVVKEELGRK